MTNNMKRLMLCLSMPVVLAAGAYAQKVSGYVLSSANQPIVDAVISCPGCESVRSADNGSFTIDGVKEGQTLSVWHDGYFRKSIFLSDNQADNLRVYLIEENRSRYNETIVTPFSTGENTTVSGGNVNINRKDFALGSLSIDNALKGELTGLQVTNKSGITQRCRWIRSLST